MRNGIAQPDREIRELRRANDMAGSGGGRNDLRPELPPSLAAPAGPAAWRWPALTISSSNIAMVATCLVLAHVTAYGGYLVHMGWDAPGWVSARDGGDEADGHVPRGARRIASGEVGPDLELDDARRPPRQGVEEAME